MTKNDNREIDTLGSNGLLLRAPSPPKFRENLLLKALTIAGANTTRRAILDAGDALSRAERDILRTCGPYPELSHAFDGVDDSRLLLTPVLSPMECREQIPLSVVSGLAEEVAGENPDVGSGDGSVLVAFVRECLYHVEGICGMLGVDSPTAADIRLVAGAAALGSPVGNVEVPCVFWKGIVSDWRKVFFAAAAAEKSLFPAVVLESMLKHGSLHGFGNIPMYCDTFGKYDAEKIASRMIPDVKALASAAVGRLSEREMLDSPDGAELGTLWILAGNTPSSPEFWIPEEFFSAERMSQAPRISFPNGGSALRSAAAELLRTGEEGDAKTGHALLRMSRFLSGCFDAPKYSRSADSFFEHPGDVDVPSPFETSGFLRRMDMLEESGAFGKSVFTMFLAECLDALSTPVNFPDRDNFQFVRRNGESPFLKLASPWLAERIHKLLSDEKYRPGLRIPRSVELSSVVVEDMPLAAKISDILAKKCGTVPFADAVVSSELLAERAFLDALASAAGKGRSADVEAFLLRTLDSLTSFEYDTLPNDERLVSDAQLEERRRSSLEAALGAYADGASALLSMIPEELADELYSRIGKRLEDFEGRLPSEDKILGMLVENAEPGEDANGLEATARAIRKTSTPAVPRLGRCGGEVSMG